MTLERFTKIINALESKDEVIKQAYNIHIDLYDFVDSYHNIISELIKEIYGDVGYDWWSWFCYENDYGKGDLEAWDENHDPICYSIESLYEYLEANHKK